MQNEWVAPSNTESVGNLVYTYEQPFSPEEDDRDAPKDTGTMASSSKVPDAMAVASGEEQKNLDDSSLDESDIAKKDYQPIPTLNAPPQYSMLALFVGNKGKALSAADNLDLVTKAKKLAIEIGSDVQSPDKIPEEGTLEKFTILIGVLRTMNTDQLRDMQGDLYQASQKVGENDEGGKVKRNTWRAFRGAQEVGENDDGGKVKNTWRAFRDAVTSAGTGPALVLISEWINDRRIDGLETMHALSSLSKAAKEPTAEYINAFFVSKLMEKVMVITSLKVECWLTKIGFGYRNWRQSWKLEGKITP